MRFIILTTKIGIWAELIGLYILLAFPSERFGPYSRKLLEEQRVGCYWLLNGNVNSIPAEAIKHYSLFGKIILALGIYALLSNGIDFLKAFLGR